MPLLAKFGSGPTEGLVTAQVLEDYARAFRDEAWEARVLQLTRDLGVGAQFGGKYFCHDVRVIRLPRHGASCPVGLGVSCSADRQALGRIDADVRVARALAVSGKSLGQAVVLAGWYSAVGFRYEIYCTRSHWCRSHAAE